MNPLSRSTHGNLRAFQMVSYMLVFLMLTCVMLTLNSLIQNMAPKWAASAIAGLICLVVIDCFILHPRLKAFRVSNSGQLSMLVAHWVVILALARLVLSFAHGSAALKTDLALLVNSDFINLLSGEYFVTCLLIYLGWSLTGQFLDLLDIIGLDPALAQAEYEDSSRSSREYVPPHQRLVSLVFGLGIVQVLLTALTRVDLQVVFGRLNGFDDVQWLRFSGAEAGALLYFLLGLGLISLSRLLTLQKQWQRQKIPVASQDLQNQWARYGLYFFFGLLLIMALLPAGDSFGLFTILGSLLGFLLVILFFVAQLVFTLVSILLSLPFLLFGKGRSFIDDFQTLPAIQPPPLDSGPIITNHVILEFLRSMLLWGALLAILIFSITVFIRQHQDLALRLRQSRLAQLIRLAWQWLSGTLNQAREGLARVVTDGWQNLRSRWDASRLAPRSGWLSLRNLDPRRRIYFFYLAMIRRTHEQGLARKPAQTPAEYASVLQERLPETDADIHDLTHGFMKARYSTHPVTAEDLQRVQTAWDRIRHGLQTLRRARKPKS